MQAAQHGELTGVRHRIREWPLQKLLVSNLRGECAIRKILRQTFERLVETLNFRFERIQPLGDEIATVEKRARVADHAGHVPQQLMWSANVFRRAEIRIACRCATHRLLRAIREGSEKMPQELARFRHGLIMPMF